jgi:hypothetical protein
VTDDVEAVQVRARARDLDLTPEEAAAVRDQLAGIREGLERARATIDVDAEEPASTFSPAGASG